MSSEAVIVPNFMRRGLGAFIKSLVQGYPKDTAYVMVAYLAAGLLEGLGVASILPILSLMGGDGHDNPMKNMLEGALGFLHLPVTLPVLLGVVVVMICAKALVSFHALKLIGYTMARISTDLRLRLMRALLGARWQHFRDLPAGRITNGIGVQAELAATAYLSLCKSLAEAMQIAIFILFSFLISWQITLLAVIVGFGIVVLFRKLITAARRAGERQTLRMSNLMERLTDAISGVKPLKAMGREGRFGAILEEEALELRAAKQDEVVYQQYLTIAREPIIAVVLAGGLLASGSFIETQMSAVLVLAFMFFRVVSKLGIIQLSYQKIASLESTYWFLLNMIDQAEAAAEKPVGNRKPTLTRSLEVRHLNFSHRGAGDKTETAKILNDVSAEFPANAFNVIIGPSGAGKTTLVDLMIGLYDTDSGDILLDGVSLRDIDRQAWRSSIGYVPQDTTLLHESILRNITLGDPAVTREDVEMALKQAGAWDFINALPDGMDTIAGEKGSRFSGGQRQRIAIARALAHKPLVLFLDEPTSAMDSATEADFLDRLDQLKTTTTLIAITHNKTLLAKADHVFTIEGGRLNQSAQART